VSARPQHLLSRKADNVNSKQIIATCKHYAVYDLETGRYGNDYDP